MKKDGIPPKRAETHWLFGDRILTCHTGGPDSIPGQCKQKHFVQFHVFCFARTQNIKIRWTANTMWLYIIFLWSCYFILQACSFIGVIRLTSPINIMCQSKAYWLFKKNWFFCFTGWFIFYKTKCLQMWNIGVTYIAVTTMILKLHHIYSRGLLRFKVTL